MTNPSKKRGQGIRSTLTAADKRRLYAALEKYTETMPDGTVRYVPAHDGEPWSDLTMATHLGLSEHHVSYVRTEAFGKLYEPEPAPPMEPEQRLKGIELALQKQAIAIERLTELLGKKTTAMHEMSACIALLMERLDKAESRLPGNDLFGSAA